MAKISKINYTLIIIFIIVSVFILLAGYLGYFAYSREKTRKQEGVLKCRETATIVKKTQESMYDGPDLSNPDYIGAKSKIVPKEETIFDDNLYQSCLKDAGIK